MGCLLSVQPKKKSTSPRETSESHTGHSRYSNQVPCHLKLWQPDEQQVQNLVGMGFAEADVRSALEAVSGDEILAIQMLCLPMYAPAGNDREPDEQQMQKLAEMGFAEDAVRSALVATNGDEILAIQMLCLPEDAPAENDTEV